MSRCSSMFLWMTCNTVHVWLYVSGMCIPPYHHNHVYMHMSHVHMQVWSYLYVTELCALTRVCMGWSALLYTPHTITTSQAHHTSNTKHDGNTISTSPSTDTHIPTPTHTSSSSSGSRIPSRLLSPHVCTRFVQLHLCQQDEQQIQVCHTTQHTICNMHTIQGKEEILSRMHIASDT